MLNMYLITALWAETDNSNNDAGGDPLDKNYDVSDVAPESFEQAKQDCEAFVQKAGSLLDGLDMESVGHDFWLTRNGHGAGFWDGDYEKKIGIKLTELSKQFGECHAYVGDDNKIYFE